MHEKTWSSEIRKKFDNNINGLGKNLLFWFIIALASLLVFLTVFILLQTDYVL